MTSHPDTSATSGNSASVTASADQKAPVQGSRRLFKTRHLSMMALGSAIGAGFFLGTGVAIAEAGPAVLISYVIAAFIAVSVMYALAELAAALPSTGSFSTYAHAGIGRWAGFTVGWLYWFMLIMVLGLEVTGAAQIFVGWFPSVPQWVPALAIVVILGGINLLAAGNFGEIEAWLSSLKVGAIIMFLLVGVGLLTGIIPGRTHTVAETVLGSGGWLPNGMAGVAVALLAIITSFGGIEVVTVAAAEAEDARRAMSKAIRSVLWRILVFYVGSVVLLVCLLPWNSEDMRTSPFAAMLNMAGVPAVGTIMEAVVFFALTSAYSANIFTSSRFAYSLSARGMGLRWLLGANAADPRETLVDTGNPIDDVLQQEAATGDISKGRTPQRAVMLSVLLSVLAVAGNWWLPESILGLLLNAIGMVLLVAWTFIIVSLIRLHPRLDEAGRISLRMPGWPVMPWVLLVLLAGMAVLMATNPAGQAQLLSMGGLAAVLVVVFFIREWWLKRRA